MREGAHPQLGLVRFGCKGRFSRGARESDELPIEVSLPHLGGSPIVARADLTGPEFRSLLLIMGSQGQSAFFSFRGAMSDTTVHLGSDQVDARQVGGPPRARRSLDSVTAATLQFRSIEFRASGQGCQGERFVRFWPTPWPPICGVTRSQTTLRAPSRRALRPGFLDPRVDVLRNGSYEVCLSKESRPIWPWPNHRRRHYLFEPALTIRDRPGCLDTPDEQFLKGAVQAGWDLCTAMSLATLQSVRPAWIERALPSERSFKVLAERPWPIPPLDSIFWLVDPDRVLEFLATSCAGLPILRERGVDPRVPITFLATEGRGIPVEPAFALAFMALEQLKDLPLLGDNSPEIVPESFFKKILRPRFSEVIERAPVCQEQAVAMKDKLTELNRPPLRLVLERLVEDLTLQIEKFGCELQPLIKMRNDLFHSSWVPAGGKLSIGLDHVRFLSGRLLLALLGWRDFSHCPSTDILNVLAKRQRANDP